MGTGKPLRWGPGTGLPLPAMMAEVQLQSQTGLSRKTTVARAVSQCGILGDLFLHRAGAPLDIPKTVACMKTAVCFLSVRMSMSPRYNPVGLANVCFEG